MNDDAYVDSRETKEEAARTRTKLTVGFVRSDMCGRELLKCCVASIPRWEFARSLYSKKKDDEGELGVCRAVKTIVAYAQEILYGNDYLTGNLLSVEDDLFCDSCRMCKVPASDGCLST